MKCALVYDFDGTLADGDCAQHGLMPALGINNVGAFWQEVKQRAEENDGDEILSYLGLLVEKASQTNPQELSVNNLKKHGKSIPLYPGVAGWFDRINTYADDNGLELYHYIISSGLDAMIRGTAIGDKFRMIFACKYHYSANGTLAVWPAQAINYTTKTQFLFRINKGIDNSWDNEAVNRFIEPELREIPFQRMIYFGDGDTDIPSMKMVRYQGGVSLAVFDQEKWKTEKTQRKVEKLIAEERANYVVPAIYEEGSQLDVTVKGLLQLFKRKYAKKESLSK
ncbi:haloacid dehalogenase-like hydrolase [Kosakonia radicincitans]|uniref:haloacid dehalogenase-like hydrolase n=1 Tax=Kosakonia radicincitans TaxID=283686 RepID=UPI0005C3044A|nr:haloacid dehalogenase-like hydrolase [Kosakonia radicincitans]KIS43727.1 phosphatase family protein [Kosakonia radicincitans YD4]